MVNNSTNINHNHLSLQLIEWLSTITNINKNHLSGQHWVMVNNSTNINKNHLSQFNYHWVMVNNSTNINKNHLSPQFIEWWSTIPPISTKITSHLNSLSDGQQFHQYQQTSPLTSTHWVMVNNSTNINKNHLSLQLIEWWSTIPPISTKITSHLNSFSDGQVTNFHQYQQKSPLTSTHWVMVNNSTNINKNHLSLQLIEWWSTIPPISTKITSHLNSLSDGQQFHQYQQKSPLTSTHWVMVNNSTNINKNHLSLQLIEWWSTIPPISTTITSHFNSLSDGQQFHQYQQKSPLTSTHWVMVNNSTNINKNHLSPQLIEWWSTIPPISTKITSHLNSLSDGQQFHQYQQTSPLTSTHWVMVNNSTNINKNHLSLQLIEWWSTIPPISTKMVNTSHLNSLSDGQQFHQYQTIPPISTKITSHFNSLNDGQQFHQYQQKSPLTSTHWVMVKQPISTKITSYQHWVMSIITPISTKITSRFNSLSMVNNSTNINKNHLSTKNHSPQFIEWWSTIPPISTKITSRLNSLSDGQQFHQYQQKSYLTSTHWVMVNNSTNINKNHLSPQLIEWWSTIPPISTKITSHLNSLSDGQQFHQYQQKSPLTSTHWVMVNNSTNINKITSHLNSLSDGQQFHQYQQKSPLTSTHWVMVNNSTNINKNHLSPQVIEWWSTIPPISTKITSHLQLIEWWSTIPPISTKITSHLHWVNFIEWWSTIPPISTKITSHFNSLSDGQQFHQYQQNHLSPQLIEWWSTIPPISTKSPFTSTHWVMVNNSTNINNNHLSSQYIEWWWTIPPISTKSPLTSTHWVTVNNSTNINKNHLSLQLIEWWSTIPPISTKIISHLNTLSDGQQFHKYQQKSPLTSTHWVMVNNSTNINKHHLSPSTHWVMSTIPPMSQRQQFHHQYQQNTKSPLYSIHWVMVNNSTNINKNHLSPQFIEWWSTIPPISTKITSQIHWVMVNTNIKNHQ